MANNPYSGLVGALKGGDSGPSIQVGEVIESLPNLTIKLGDLQIDKDNIMIADYLLDTYKRQVSIKEGVPQGKTNSVSVGDHGSHDHSLTKFGVDGAGITFEDTLKKGDKLAVLATSDIQSYIVLARLVSL